MNASTSLFQALDEAAARTLMGEVVARLRSAARVLGQAELLPAARSSRSSSRRWMATDRAEPGFVAGRVQSLRMARHVLRAGDMLNLRSFAAAAGALVIPSIAWANPTGSRGNVFTARSSGRMPTVVTVRSMQQPPKVTQTVPARIQRRVDTLQRHIGTSWTHEEQRIKASGREIAPLLRLAETVDVKHTKYEQVWQASDIITARSIELGQATRRSARPPEARQGPGLFQRPAGGEPRLLAGRLVARFRDGRALDAAERFLKTANEELDLADKRLKDETAAWTRSGMRRGVEEARASFESAAQAQYIARALVAEVRRELGRYGR